MRDPVFPAFCALGIVLCLLPLPWHWRARNYGTLIYVGWTVTGCLVFMVNALVWAGNMNDRAPVWCDITSRLVIALSAALPASSLCVQRRLHRIAVIKEVAMLRDARRKELIIDLLIGIGLPALVVVLHHIVQPARYLIVEDIGCWPVTLSTVLIVPLVFIWPVLISFTSFIYAALTIRAFFTTRRQFSRVLSESETDLNMSRFFRLMALAGTDMSFSFTLSLYFMASSITTYPLAPWVSWEDTHQYINEVLKQSQAEVLAVPGLKIANEINRWALPACAFLFFMFFGLSSEAMKQYKLIFWRLAAPFGLRSSEAKEVLPTTSWTRRLAPGRRSADRPNLTSLSTTRTILAASPLNSNSGNLAGSQVELDGDLKKEHPVVSIKNLESQI